MRQLRPAMAGRGRRLRRAGALGLPGVLVFAISGAWAGPQDGSVAAGSASISRPAAGVTQINQSSAKAVIDWRSFSVGKDEQVVFQQPSTAAIALNRVTGSDASQIDGRVSANGQVWVVN